MLEMLAAR